MLVKEATGVYTKLGVKIKIRWRKRPYNSNLLIPVIRKCFCLVLPIKCRNVFDIYRKQNGFFCNEHVHEHNQAYTCKIYGPFTGRDIVILCFLSYSVDRPLK